MDKCLEVKELGMSVMQVRSNGVHFYKQNTTHSESGEVVGMSRVQSVNDARLGSSYQRSPAAARALGETRGID